MARPAGEFDASRYFRGTRNLGFYNVGTSRVRALARSIYHDHKDKWTVDDALAFADALVVDRYLEVNAAGVELMACYRKGFNPRLLPIWKRCLATDHSDNWVTTDSIRRRSVGCCVKPARPILHDSSVTYADTARGSLGRRCAMQSNASRP